MPVWEEHRYPWYRIVIALLSATLIGVLWLFMKFGGSILASIFISLLEALASIRCSPAQAVSASFGVLILTLLFRPTGLFVPTPK